MDYYLTQSGGRKRSRSKSSRKSRKGGNNWTKAVAKARKELGITGFMAVKKGTPLYMRAKEIYSAMGHTIGATAPKRKTSRKTKRKSRKRSKSKSKKTKRSKSKSKKTKRSKSKSKKTKRKKSKSKKRSRKRSRKQRGRGDDTSALKQILMQRLYGSGY